MLPALLAAVLLTPHQDRPCDRDPAPLAASADLYCIRLTAAPGVAGVTGRLELARIPGPFTVAVTGDGTARYHAVFTLAGLPEPATVGAATYVAWVAPPLMAPLHRLGEVSIGTHAVGEIALNKFVVLVTAEPSPDASRPSGRPILRGLSPSSRMQPADLFEFSIGAAPASDAASAHSHQGGDDDGWGIVPMPPGLTMLAAEMLLRPRAEPYLPATGDAPPARPREIVRLATGDTLRLEAGFVRRRLHGRTFTMFGFNGQYPGPLLWVPQDAEIVVDFTNRLDQPTTVHWHGLRLDNRFDGVPHVTQEPVPAGGRFAYHLRFPDAGVYWYHPHVREDVQQDLGLYGNMLVRSPRADYYGPAHREEVLMLDDLLVADHGPVPYGAETATHAMMGRFGNVFLVNGEPSYALTVHRGEVVRFFLTNVSNTRTFNVSFPGARMKVVGSDVGVFEREAWVESAVIAPAERYVVHVRFDAPGETALVNRIQGIDHLYGRFFAEADTLGRVRVDAAPVAESLDSAFALLREHDHAVSEIDRYRRHFDRPPDHALVLTIETRDLPLVTRRLMQVDSIYFNPVEWSGTMPMMNWAATTEQVRWILRDPATGLENMDVSWQFTVGDIVKIRLHNARESFHAMQHPIHLHGQRFLVLAANGVPNDNLVWKDTVLLPAGGTVDILLELSNPGRWMLHCHIAEHIEAGMMTTFRVRSKE
jgi:FtsP/CotA-like multicopper oxidase with cupredoxin domain